MAHVSIISSQSGEQIFEGAPRYIGAYLKPGYLEFQAIGSPTAISWHVGDYVVYPRTGKTYRLYRTPQIAEQGDTMRYGAAFLYENVQFFDDSKRLELCPFTDLVPGDNTIHFSTQNVVSFFGKPLNVAERVQACLENQYGAGTWEVRIVTTTDPDLLELLDTEVEFSVSGASCQQALDKVYELWNGLGWIHTVENGVNVITIGASNVRTNANTTVPFAYDDGLVRVERSIANADQIGTRLFAYGSMKNMDATYYRGLDIKDAESVDIEHLMIPLANWGLTDNKPDARKAFIEDAAAIAKLGLIPRTAYFDGTGDLPDIHPTIERMTIGEVYDAGGAGYIPNLSKWSRGQRIDEIVSAVNPTDHGTSAEQGQKYTEDISSHLAAITDTFINNDTVSWTIFSVNTNNPGRLTLNFGQEPQPITLTTAWTPQLDLKLAVYAGGKRVEAPLTIRQASSTAWQIILPESVVVSGAAAGLVDVRIEGVITNTAGGQTTVEGSFSTNASTAVTGGVEYELPKTFTITIPQIGFDIEKYAALGNGKTISMKTGMCAGRDFEIKSAKYVSSTDSWLLTLYRSSDEDLGIMFPNADYQIAAGDQYVLLDIAMPDMYVTVASNRLLDAARKLLTDISSERPFYSPQIDAKVVYNESRVLLEGMWMDVAFDSSREYVLIDSITIDENGSNIPTYEVSLREKKGVEWTENVGKSSSSKSSVSVNGNETEQETGVRSVGMTVPEGLTVQGSPITGAGVFKVGIANGYKIPLISELANYFELAADPTLVQLRQAYSYLGPRKGLIFDANEEADTNADFEKVALPGGGYALHSRLPFYSDSFISAGGISPGGGASAGNATLVAQTYGGTLSATGIDPINFYSKEKVDQLLATAGTVQTVAGVSPTTSGDIPVASLKSALGLGAAAAYGIGSVASGNTGLVTGGSVYSAINEAVSSVMKMQGTTTTPLSDGSTTNLVVIDGESYTAKKGDVVLYDGKEYLWAGSAWEQLGDEASWALKTTTISAGTGLDGGGTLASNRTISINPTYQTYISNGNTAYGWGNHANAGYLLAATAASTYATITALNGVSGRVTTLEGRTNWDTYFGVDENGDVYVKKNGDTARNFYSYGAASAGGLSDGGGSGGIDPEAMWQLLGDSTNEQIAASHLTTALNGYATQQWVNNKGYITGITSSMVTTALGYTPVSPTDLTTALWGYLPLTAGSDKPLTGQLCIRRSNTSISPNASFTSGTAGVSYMELIDANANLVQFGYMSGSTWGVADKAGMYLYASDVNYGIGGLYVSHAGLFYTDNVSDFDRYTVYHSGNFVAGTNYLVPSSISDMATQTWVGQNYLPKTGGTLSSSGQILLALNTTSGSGTGIQFKVGNTTKAEVGFWSTYAYLNNPTAGSEIEVRDDKTIVFVAPNSWLSHAYLQLMRYDSTAYTDRACIGVTNGNLHIDSYPGSDIYLNHYSGESIVHIGNNIVLHTGNYSATLNAVYHPYGGGAIAFTASTLTTTGQTSLGNGSLIVKTDGSIYSTPTYSFSSWTMAAAFGSDSADKAVIGQLSGYAWVGGHNATLSSWAPIRIAGTEIRFMKDGSTIDGILSSSGMWRFGTSTPADGNDIIPFAVANAGYSTSGWCASFGTSSGGVLAGYRSANTTAIIGTSHAGDLWIQPDGGILYVGSGNQWPLILNGPGTQSSYYFGSETSSSFNLKIYNSIGNTCSLVLASSGIAYLSGGLNLPGNIVAVSSSQSGWSPRIIAGDDTYGGVAFLGNYSYGSTTYKPGVHSHNAALTAWNDLGLGGYNIYFYVDGSTAGYIDVSKNLVMYGAITAGSASDARLKTNIQTMTADAALRLVMALRPVTFDWNSTATELYDQYKGNDLGFIAQEVEPYLPQAIGTIFEKYMRLDQTKVIAPLVAVVQDHETRIRQLERENAELKRRLNMN